MNTWTAISFLLAYIFARRGGLGDRNPLHPVRVFGALWYTCLALASLRWLPSVSDWDWLFWMGTLISPALFGVAFHSLSRRKQRWFPAEKIALNPALLVAFICLAIGLIASAREYALIGSVPILSSNVDVARFRLATHPQLQTEEAKVVELLVLFLRYAGFIAVALLPSRRLVSGIILLVAFAALASQGGRTLAFDLVIVSGALFHYLHRRFRPQELVLGAIAVCLAFGAAGYIRARQSGYAWSTPTLYRASIGSSLQGQFWGAMRSGYFSMTAPMEGLYRIRAELPHISHEHGFTFYAFHRFIPRDSIQKLVVQLGDSEFMATTYLGDLYADIGGFAFIFAPLAFGMLYGWLYRRASTGQLYWVTLNAVAFGVLVYFAYFNMIFQFVNWVCDVVILSFSFYLIREFAAIAQRSRLNHLPVSVPR